MKGKTEIREIRGVRLDDYDTSAPWDKLKAKREEFVRAAEGILNKAESEKRNLTESELKDFDELTKRAEMITKELETRMLNGTREHIGPVFKQLGVTGGENRYMREGQVPLLSREQRMAECIRQDRQYDRPLSIGKYLRGIITGNWDGADAERRALSEGTLAAGGYLVPTELSATVIDKARNKARVIQAGAVTVPMQTQTLKIARVTGDPTAAWKAENAAGTVSDLTFDAITFNAKTLFALVKLSVELFEDAPNVDAVVENALAQALAVELDRAALRGSGVDPEPRGIRNVSGVQLIDMGANGGQLTDYSKFSQAVQKIQEANGPDAEALSVIYAPRTAATLDSKTDNTGQPLQPPASFRAMRKFVTNQIPVNLTKGTANNATDAYVGDFSQCLIGMRTNLTLEVSRTAADSSSSAFTNAQVWVRAYLRADVQVARPDHFVVINGIIP